MNRADLCRRGAGAAAVSSRTTSGSSCRCRGLQRWLWGGQRRGGEGDGTGHRLYLPTVDTRRDGEPANRISACHVCSANRISACRVWPANRISACRVFPANRISACCVWLANRISACCVLPANGISACLVWSANGISVCCVLPANRIAVCAVWSANRISACRVWSANRISVCCVWPANRIAVIVLGQPIGIQHLCCAFLNRFYFLVFIRVRCLPSIYLVSFRLFNKISFLPLSYKFPPSFRNFLISLTHI